MIIPFVMPGTRTIAGILVFASVFALFSSTAFAQKIAILAPKDDAPNDAIAQEFSAAFGPKAIDLTLADAAYRSVKFEDPFNLTANQGKQIGAVIGCSGSVIVKAETLRRTSSAQPVYFESYVAIFAVVSRTGHLAYWKLITSEDSSREGAERNLLDSFRKVSANLIEEINDKIVKDTPAANTGFEEMPENGSREAKNFRPPIPYLRIKPEYTPQAYLYDAKGTVEIQVDLDDKGNIVATEIKRWVGFGLEDSVTQAVRKMNWRPGERDGKPLPTRFLLRYNFKKIDKE
ncbi:MAG: energy transducer TonB [Acidobacteriota bacterium]